MIDLEIELHHLNPKWQDDYENLEAAAAAYGLAHLLPVDVSSFDPDYLPLDFG